MIGLLLRAGGASAATGLLVFLSACASIQPSSAAPSASDLDRLEGAHRARPMELSTAPLLAAAYLRVGRLDEARRVTTESRAALPEDPELILLQGLVEEAAGQEVGARELYLEYVRVGPEEPFASEARGRAERIALDNLPEAMRLAASRGAELDRVVPDLYTVAALPFAVDRADPRAEPLARTLADLTPFDLAMTQQFQAVERSRVRALLAAMGVTAADVTDPDLAVRVGQTLGAGIVIQGSLRVMDEFYVEVEANVVLVGERGTRTVIPFESQALMAQVGAVERRLALLAAETAGIAWAGPFQQRFGRSSSQHMPAWLDYGRGLIAFEAADYATAEAAFREALQRDADFDRALQRANDARYLLAASEAPGEFAWRAAQLGSQRNGVLALLESADSRQWMLRGLAGERRAVLAELLGQDRVGTGSVIELILTSGGGGAR